MTVPNEVPVTRAELARVSHRISFLYVERATVNRDNNALTITDYEGTSYVPATTLAALLLGPGTRITYAAMALLGDAGVAVSWVGTKGTRFYAAGRPPAKSSRFAEAQAMIVTNQRRRLDCARKMYSMRFGDEDVSMLTMNQLRGREGARMKKVYRECAENYGVAWSRRTYDPTDFESGDPINRALTTANAALYGVVHAVIAALGFVPSLGVVHTGTDRSFVYDIADLYKASISIPSAFAAVAEVSADVEGQTRRNVRAAVVTNRFLPAVVRDLYSLMEVEEDVEDLDIELMLWSELERIKAGSNWSEVGDEAR